MKPKKQTVTPRTPLPANWKTTALYNCQGETYCCEITRYANGKYLEPVWMEPIQDWVCSMTLVEGEILGLEGQIKVGESIGYCINNKLWL